MTHRAGTGTRLRRSPLGRARRRAAVLLCAAAAAVAAGGAQRPAHAQASPGGGAERPNILFILTDDQAPWAVSSAREAHPQVRTPNLDRLAREGAYLPNAFTATPVCSPSRAELMTSRYGSELGITDWINDAREPALGLAPETITWTELLQRAGYATGLVGKWHLGVRDEYHPTRTGFDYFLGFRDGGTTPENPVLESGGAQREIEGFTTEILTDSAIAFLRRNRAGPFALALHYRAPHAPWLPLPAEDWAPYAGLDPWLPHPDYPDLDTAAVKKRTREYLGSVASVDRNVGRLLAELAALGLAENTVVVFTSDHGYNMGHNGIWHKGNGHWIVTDPPPATGNVPRGQRPNLYDNSLRVPALVRWPAAIAPGTVVERTVTNLDWYPTLLAMAGVRPAAGETVRGRDFLPLLRGRDVAGWDDDLYAEYSTHHQSWTHMRGWRTPEWKLVRDYLNPSRDELYHLAIDPEETTNVIASTDPAVRRVIAELDARIQAKLRELNDPVLHLVRPPRPDVATKP